MNALGMFWLLMKGKIIAKVNRENDASCVLHQRNAAGCRRSCSLPGISNLFLLPRALEEPKLLSQLVRALSG